MKLQVRRLEQLGAAILCFALAAASLGCQGGFPWANSAIDGGARTATEERRLCDPGDSSTDSSFTYRLVAGHLQNPGRAAMSENGFRYLHIDKGCRFWLYDAGWAAGSWGAAWSGVLSPVQAKAYAESLRIADWSQWVGNYDGPYADGPVWKYSYAGQEIVAGDGEMLWLSEAIVQVFRELASYGTSWTGNIRWVLVQAGATVSDQLEYRNAPAWPLGMKASDVAMTAGEAYSYTPGHSQLSSGDDAAKLNEVRRQFLAGTIGYSGAAFLPIQQPDGVRYRLFVRDSIPLEDANGLISFSTRP